VLSYAQSLDGSLTTERGVHTNVSGPEAFKLAHFMRASVDAIFVGVGTVLSDNPRLTTRLVEGDDPQRVLLDSMLRTPLDAALLQQPSPAWVMTTQNAPVERKKLLRGKGIEVFEFSPNKLGKVPLPEVVKILGGLGIRSLMIEGGGEIITSFLQHNLADLVLLTISPRFFGGYPAVGASLGGQVVLENSQITPLGGDFILYGDIRK
jgi:riboflavin-specific deaminase-like protein